VLYLTIYTTVWRCTLNIPLKSPFKYKYVVSNGTAYINLSAILSFTPKDSSYIRDDGHFGSLYSITFPALEQKQTWLHSQSVLALTVGYPEFYLFSPTHPRLGVQIPKSEPSLTLCTSLWSGRTKLSETTHDIHTSASFNIPNLSSLTSVLMDIVDANISLGKVNVLASQFSTGHGVLSVPIIDASFIVVGSITFHYSIITPFTHTALQQCTRRPFPAKPTLVGHRGSGAEGSRNLVPGSPRSHIKENTLLSFEKAGTMGAHFVEFDIHLTADMVPVIYHDFSIAHSGISSPIHSLTLEEFKKIGSKMVKKSASLTSLKQYLPPSKLSPDTSVKSQLPLPILDNFPTLKETLQQVPSNIGFNVEIKYPMKDELEQHNLRPVDRNVYVDCILWTVFEYAKDREIVFSSFDPDVCVLLSRKQPKYPVLFLTEMGTVMRSDPRSNSPDASIHFAVAVGLQGVVCPASFLLRNPQVVEQIKKANLVVATWGRDNNTTTNVDNQLAMGVNGIIVDHVAFIAKHWYKAVQM